MRRSAFRWLLGGGALALGFAGSPPPLEAPMPQGPGAAASPNAVGLRPVAPRPHKATETFHFLPALEFQFRRGDGFHDPQAIAIADITGDGRADLIGAATYNQILLWKQLPDGTLSVPVPYVYESDNYLNRGELAIGDLNSDGLPDAAASGLLQTPVFVDNDMIDLLLSDRSGEPVQRQVRLEGVGKLSGWQLLDVDRDGRPDLVGATAHTFPPGTHCGRDGEDAPTDCPAIGIAHGDGAGGFSRFEAAPIGTPYGLGETEVGDVDGDGLDDLIAVSTPPSAAGTLPVHEVSAFRTRREGGFAPRDVLYTMPGPLGGVSIAAGDVDADGDHQTDTLSVEWASILRVRTLGQGPAVQRQYDPATPFDRRVLWANALLAADIDGDRRPDGLMSQMRWMGDDGIMQIAVYLQRGGTLQPPQYIDAAAPHAGLTNRTLAVGDLDGDGCRDLAIAGANSRLVLLYGAGCSAYVHRRVASRGVQGRAPLPSSATWRTPLASPAMETVARPGPGAGERAPGRRTQTSPSDAQPSPVPRLKTASSASTSPAGCEGRPASRA